MCSSRWPLWCVVCFLSLCLLAHSTCTLPTVNICTGVAFVFWYMNDFLVGIVLKWACVDIARVHSCVCFMYDCLVYIALCGCFPLVQAQKQRNYQQAQESYQETLVRAGSADMYARGWSLASLFEFAGARTTPSFLLLRSTFFHAILTTVATWAVLGRIKSHGLLTCECRLRTRLV